jgi:D-amino-acid dehydrogenase
VVVGAGIVGLATAYHLLARGATVTVVDRDVDGDKASFGNAGGIAVTEMVPASAPGIAWRALGWMMDPLGPLSIRPAHAPRLLPWLAAFARAGRPAEIDGISAALAMLNSHAIADLDEMFTRAQLRGQWGSHGALTLYETAKGFRRDAGEWARKRAAGFICEDISLAQAREMEPALTPNLHCAVFTPQWRNIQDPHRLMSDLGAWLRQSGVTLRDGDVTDIVAPSSVRLSDGTTIPADFVVVATGAWSARLANSLGDRVLLESERGYNFTIPSPNIHLACELIFAERKFVATQLSCGLRIGGAAEFGGLTARPNYKRSQALIKQAARYLPDLNAECGTSWAGHRPTTPDSLPVIGPSPRHAKIFYAFGHGHLGLTQAATTGRLIAEQVFGDRPSLDLAPFAVSRFARNHATVH